MNMKMRLRNATSGLLLAVLLLIAGCATTPRTTPDIPVLGDLVGSRWRLVYDNPNFGHREYDLVFLEAGKLINTHPNEKTPDDDRWESSGRKIVLRFNNGYAVYTGELSDDNHMAGNAASKAGGKWKWTAYRIGKQEKQ
jgi:hypothetical protein